MAGMTRHINLDLKDKLFQRLTNEAKENEISRNKFIRTILGEENFFNKIKKSQEGVEAKLDKILKKLDKK